MSQISLSLSDQRCNGCENKSAEVALCDFCDQLKCPDCMCLLNVCVECMAE